MDQPERSRLELYARVIDAYQQAGVWPLIKHVYMESGNKWRANKWFWIPPGTLILITLIAGIPLGAFSMSTISILLLSISCFLIIVMYLFFIDFKNKIKDVFKDDIRKYGIVVQLYREYGEFYRFLFFRNQLAKYGFGSKDAKNIKPLLSIDQQTLGSYVAQRALMVWTASTLTAVLAASATTWHFSFVIIFSVCGLFLLIILYVIRPFFGNQRRRYELQRWLAWYEADAPEPTALTPDGTNPPAG